MITPIELHNRQHKTGRGYKKKEMDIFLDEVFENYEQLYKENVELKDKISRLSDGVQQYKTMESALQKALVLAEKTSKDTIESAGSKAAVIEKEAKLKADTIVNNALSQSEEIKKQCISLLKQYNQFKAQYKQIALKQIELLDGDFYEIYSKDLIDAIDEAPKGDRRMASESADIAEADVIPDSKPDEISGEKSDKISGEIPDKKTSEISDNKPGEIPDEKTSEISVNKPDNVTEHIEKPYAEKPNIKKPHIKKPHIENPHTEKPRTDKPYTEKPDAVSYNADIPVNEESVPGEPLTKYIDRAIKIGSDMAENGKKPKVSGDTKEFTPLESQAIIDNLKDREPKEGQGEPKVNDDEEIDNSIRKIRSQLAADRKKSNNGSSFEFFDNE